LSTPPPVRLKFFEEGLVCRRVGLCERSGSALLLILDSSLHVGIAALAATLSGQSRLIGHRRVGRRGCHPWVLKSRTMSDRRQPFRPRAFVRTECIDDCLGPGLKIPDDARMSTRFAFCRRHSLDELRQLVHVADGRMSLGGRHSSSYFWQVQS
jgi:lipopolysaccharide/colanic/teichoic acid biosynthesis glycosyltransferase